MWKVSESDDDSFFACRLHSAVYSFVLLIRLKESYLGFCSPVREVILKNNNYIGGIAYTNLCSALLDVRDTVLP